MYEKQDTKKYILRMRAYNMKWITANDIPRGRSIPCVEWGVGEHDDVNNIEWINEKENISRSCNTLPSSINIIHSNA